MRPSPGVVPHDDHIHAFNPTSIRGPMARTVADTQLFLAGMVSGGPDPFDQEVSSDDIKEVKAWLKERQLNPSMVNWRFTIKDARIKLKRLYPALQTS